MIYDVLFLQSAPNILTLLYIELLHKTHARQCWHIFYPVILNRFIGRIEQIFIVKKKRWSTERFGNQNIRNIGLLYGP